MSRARPALDVVSGHGYPIVELLAIPRPLGTVHVPRCVNGVDRLAAAQSDTSVDFRTSQDVACLMTQLLSGRLEVDRNPQSVAGGSQR